MGKRVIELHYQAQSKDVTAAVRQMAAHEARNVLLTNRIGEVREYFDHAGLRLQAREVHAQQGE